MLTLICAPATLSLANLRIFETLGTEYFAFTAADYASPSTRSCRHTNLSHKQLMEQMECPSEEARLLFPCLFPIP